MTLNQKTEKAQRIAKAALKLFQQYSFDEITMAQIAKTAGVSKGTLFNYYDSKENIFMNLLLVGYQAYFESLDGRIQQRTSLTVIEFKNLVLKETSELIKEHATLIRLNALRGPILEEKADKTQTMTGRKKLYEVTEKLSQDIAAKNKALLPESVSRLFITQSAVISGLMNLSGLNEFNREKLPIGFFNFEINVEQEARTILSHYMNGLFRKKKVDEQK